MADPVTVAIPVRNGGSTLAATLAAVRAQRLDRPVELLVADSGSSDGSRELARRHGAELIDIPPGAFCHGRTRNILAERSQGSHIAFLTQDAVPASEQWLAHLLRGFEAGEDVGLVFGPYVARADSSLMVRRELDRWFSSLSTEPERGLSEPPDVRRSFFTDANGCVARNAWERVPFRFVQYAEDHMLARDMLAAGYAKVFCPEAAVIHSHDYRPVQQLQRSFDEWRGLREVGAIEAAPAIWPALLGVQRAARDDLAWASHEGYPLAKRLQLAFLSLRHHCLRAAGEALGARAGRLPPMIRRALSLENRAGFRIANPPR